ncbi:MAG: hypothetical protein LUD19_00895 [Clostridia bacterium]|nr:hypothetical protein [Clostridia bacterium]MCD8308380.1 hypothetical protein [Clostridia bacterium]
METTEQKKSGEEILAEIYRNAHLALQSISDILPQTEDGAVKCEIMREHEEYERICGKAAELAKKLNSEVKEPNPMKKAMMWSAIKMNTAADNSDQHIAELMIRGTVTGITALKTSRTDGGEITNQEVKDLLDELISLEEGFEENLKAYL